MNIKHTIAIAALSALALTGAAHAAPPSGTAADYGVAVPAAAAQRAITINADTKWVNVTDGETVRFDVNGQSFTWHFSTYPQISSFDLARIAPAGVTAGSVRVYIATNPLYRG
ncbi:CzcE family metal-binding protein [Duganella callida]|uniref:CzcE family metal-binding protein n=1 Tax=Duganella callida TaxID=2561932 RepID=A0A4Y9SS80_9BURK|nr:CzcE family metal-binding protein [Duganella callida]TFW29471.1 CzcE family metal-binding protein [Duganella callida]